jgi:hypothetical protein
MSEVPIIHHLVAKVETEFALHDAFIQSCLDMVAWTEQPYLQIVGYGSECVR